MLRQLERDAEFVTRESREAIRSDHSPFDRAILPEGIFGRSEFGCATER
jgi:hypothetical protein